MNPNRPTQIRLWWMAAGVAVVALVSALWWWTGTGGGVLLLALAVCARAFVRLSRAGQRQQGQEDLLARRFRNILAPESSCPMPPYYDGWNLIEERDSTGAVVATYVHGANVDEMLTMTRGGQTYSMEGVSPLWDHRFDNDLYCSSSGTTFCCNLARHGQSVNRHVVGIKSQYQKRTISVVDNES